VGLFSFRAKSNLINPENWLIDAFGGVSESESGVQINADTMMTESAVWCAINFLASNIASLPCPVLKVEGRKKNKDKEHFLYHRLNVMANEEMTSMVWRETCLYYLLLWGYAVSIIVRNNLGEVTGLYPVHPDRIVEIKRVAGNLKYTILLENNKEKTFPDYQILRITGLGNGLLGLSALEYSKNSIGLVLAMRTFANLFFKNGSNLGVVFSHPGRLGEQAHKNLRQSLKDSYAGLGSSHTAMLAEEGITVNKIGTEPDKSQLLEARQFAITDVARWFNLPPHTLKDLSNANYSNMQQQSLELIIFSFRPLFVRLEQSYEAFLLRDFEQPFYSVRHNANALLRGDDESRGNYYKIRFNTGSITPNEIRQLEDENIIDETWADKTYLQLNLVPADQLENLQEEQIQSPNETPKNEDQRSFNIEEKSLKQIAVNRDRVKDTFTPVLRDGLQNILNKELIALRRELKKQLAERAKSDFSIWIDDFYNKFGDYIKKNLESTITAYSKEMQQIVAGEIDLEDVDFDDISNDVRGYLTGYIRQYISSSRGQILQQLEQDNFEAVQTRADEWENKRIDKELSEVSVGVGSMVARSVILGGGYALVWRNRGSSTCPLCKQLNGRKIYRKTDHFTDENETFKDSKNNKVTFRKTLYSPLHKGCDCILTAV